MNSSSKNSTILFAVLWGLAINAFANYYLYISSYTLLFSIILVSLVSMLFRIPRLFIFLGLSFSLINHLMQLSTFIANTLNITRFLYLIENLLPNILLSCLCGAIIFKEKVFFRRFSLILLVNCLVLVVIFKEALLYSDYLFHLILFITAFSAITFSAGSINFKNSLTRSNQLLWLFVSLLIIFTSYFTLNSSVFEDKVQRIGFLDSQWGNISNKYNTSDYGLKSGYSYSLLAEMLSNKYKVEGVNYKSLNQQLKHLNVLISITPTQILTGSEKKLIIDWIKQGGRLVLIADHTDLYGSSRVINYLLEDEKFKINYDALFKPDNYYEKAFLQFSSIKIIRPKTPCSVSLYSPFITVFSWTKDWVSEKADYLHPTFFSDFTWTSDDIRGNFPIGLIARKGKGEIVTWTDSTIFANFTLFQPNHLKLLLSMVEKGEVLKYLSYFFYAVVFVVIGYLFLFRLPDLNMLSLLVSLLISFSGVLYNFTSNDLNLYPPSKTVKIYGDEENLQEQEPGKMCSGNSVSSLLSHIARAGLYPKYSGEKPVEPEKNKTIWVTNSERLSTVSENTKKSLWGILLIDDNEKELLMLGFNPYSLNDEIPEVLKPIFINSGFTRKIFTTNKMVHSGKLKGINYVSLSGILTDRFIGDWWINAYISPYRNFYLQSFFNWLYNHEPIAKYKYPSIGIKKSNKKWTSKNVENQIVETGFEIIRGDNYPFIYLGGGQWAIHEQAPNGEYLYSSLELSDDQYLNRNTRVAAKSN